MAATHLGGAKAEANKDALRRNPEYTQYIQNLVSAGYFNDEKEGSRLWSGLETKAAAVFMEIRSFECANYITRAYG